MSVACKESVSIRVAGLTIRSAFEDSFLLPVVNRMPLPRRLILATGARIVVLVCKRALTMYKPNFCAECGERIERLRWRFWTSRRFCASCARRFRRGQILWPLMAGATVFCLGLAAGRSGRSTPPPLIIERGQLAALPATAATKTTTLTTETVEAGADSQASPKPEPSYGPDGTATERPTDPNEIVSICGARTQKGTPCKRRVRGTGRCWQHKGMPAMLPPSKLIVQGQ
jgi:hypothetical protein